MNRRQLVQTWNTLQELRDIDTVKAAYFVAKNLRILKPEIEDIQRVAQQDGSPGFQEFEAERITLAKAHSRTTANGDALMVDGHFDLDPEKECAFTKAFAELSEKYKDALAKENQRALDVKEFLDEDVAVEFYTLAEANICAGIKARHIETFMEFGLIV